MDLIKIKVPDRGDWLGTFAQVRNWMNENYPNFNRRSDQWEVTFGQNDIFIHIGDADIAMMLKLRWG